MFSEDHRRIIEAVSRQVSGTLRSALVFEERKRSALRDDLTGLPSIERLHLITGGDMQTEEAIREGASIILVDVDHLSDINGRFGRQAGDEVLAQVAVALRRILKGQNCSFGTQVTNS